jgi:hypothetical protein
MVDSAGYARGRAVSVNPRTSSVWADADRPNRTNSISCHATSISASESNGDRAKLGHICYTARLLGLRKRNTDAKHGRLYLSYRTVSKIQDIAHSKVVDAIARHEETRA